MKKLDNPIGVFDLHNSDIFVGSYFKKNDIKEILNITDNDLKEIDFIIKDNIEVIDERKIQKLWYDNKIPNAPANKSGRAKISFDEFLLISLIKQTYPESIIEHQVNWGRKKIDFRITNNNETKIIEFHGPGHFTNIGYGVPENPFIRKDLIEKEFKQECVIYPYWIQRCNKNIKAIFEKNIEGLGVLWTTKIHFGHFSFKNSAQIIDEITKRFNAVNKEGYGYFYQNSKGRNNIEHPILDKIKNNKSKVEILLPNGYKNKSYWLPEILQ
jgi:hypothetical protein